METSSFAMQALCLLSLFSAARVAAQWPCSASSAATCDAYVAYHAQPPEYGSIESVADLFGVASTSLGVAAGKNALAAGQLVLVPITCGCNGSRYSADVKYIVRPGDTFYYVAVHSFQNLTHWQTAVDMNPALKPSLLHAGDELVIPLLCGCPSQSSVAGDGIRYLITYVWQPEDNVASIGAEFNVSESDIVSAAEGSPALIPVSRLPVLLQPRHGGLKRRWIVAAATISAGALILSGLVILFAYTLCLCGRRRTLHCEELASESKQHKLLPGLSGYLGKPTVYDMATIMDATMDLDETCQVGDSVFKAFIDGKFVAVKRVREEDQFAEELQILQKVNHGNLVNLLGISSGSGGGAAGFLVYELAENGTLEACLVAGLLGWRQRLQVALDVAHGLQYLHEHAQPSLVHGHINTSNIVLDAGFKAKIANFSKASLAENWLVLKADVFAFGKVVFELLSGTGGGETLVIRHEVGWVLASESGGQREERVGKWIDAKLEGAFPVEGAVGLMGLAMACTQETALSRPSMGEIVFSLSLLTQALESSWTCTSESEELVRIRIPVTAR